MTQEELAELDRLERNAAAALIVALRKHARELIDAEILIQKILPIRVCINKVCTEMWKFFWSL